MDAPSDTAAEPDGLRGIPATGRPDENGMEMGPQPLDALMSRLAIDNHALVAASTDHLTHKMVAKGRRGRRLTLNVQDKICRALNSVLNQRSQEPVAARQLFTYRIPVRER